MTNRFCDMCEEIGAQVLFNDYDSHEWEALKSEAFDHECNARCIDFDECPIPWTDVKRYFSENFSDFMDLTVRKNGHDCTCKGVKNVS